MTIYSYKCIFRYTSSIRISIILSWGSKSYQCYLAKAVTRGLFNGCNVTKAHVRQVTSVFSQSGSLCDIASQRIQ